MTRNSIMLETNELKDIRNGINQSSDYELTPAHIYIQMYCYSGGRFTDLSNRLLVPEIYPELA